MATPCCPPGDYALVTAVRICLIISREGSEDDLLWDTPCRVAEGVTEGHVHRGGREVPVVLTGACPRDFVSGDGEAWDLAPIFPHHPHSCEGAHVERQSWETGGQSPQTGSKG